MNAYLHSRSGTKALKANHHKDNVLDAAEKRIGFMRHDFLQNTPGLVACMRYCPVEICGQLIPQNDCIKRIIAALDKEAG